MIKVQISLTQRIKMESKMADFRSMKPIPKIKHSTMLLMVEMRIACCLKLTIILRCGGKNRQKLRTLLRKLKNRVMKQQCIILPS
jgi:hypothetical protein